jgi:catechol 2,3-dioxygenase-like lactoylglutathione lyase family enzyme
MTVTDPLIESAAAIVPVRDVSASIAFYVDVLGFERRFIADDASYAVVGRGSAVFHLQRCSDADALRATANNIAIYVAVRGVDQLYEQQRPMLAALPDGRVRPPLDQPYGMREFHVKDPDGCLLFFGEAIPS